MNWEWAAQVLGELVDRFGEALQPRSSVQIAENSKGEPAITTKCYDGNIEALRAVTDAALAEYKRARREVMQP